MDRLLRQKRQGLVVVETSRSSDLPRLGTANENHEWLIEQYVSCLAAQEPEGILDVGCGSGLLLKACKKQGLAASGLDAAGPRLEQLRAEGFDVSVGTAYELPMEDLSVDWVSLRHVPHHLEDPALAFRELLRVARTGVLIAEPFFDVSVESQAAASKLDIWEKRQHRRGGMVHDEVYSLGTLLGMMPHNVHQKFTVEGRTDLRLRARDVCEFHDEAKAYVQDLDPEHAECTALEHLIVDFESSGLSWNGSQLLVLMRR